MKVSIIIPVYNAQGTIKKAVSSALDQKISPNDFEVVVINDGSTDKTIDILKNYEKKIILINQKNKGAVRAANVGFRCAKGKYVIKLDADDYFAPTILKEMTRVLEKNRKIDFVYSDYYEKIGNGRLKIVSTKNIFNILAGGIMFRKNKFKEEGFYRESIKFPEYDLLFKTERRWRGFHITKPLYYYIREEKSLSKQKKWVKKALAELKALYPPKIKEIEKIRKY